MTLFQHGFHFLFRGPIPRLPNLSLYSNFGTQLRIFSTRRKNPIDWFTPSPTSSPTSSNSSPNSASASSNINERFKLPGSLHKQRDVKYVVLQAMTFNYRGNSEWTQFAKKDFQQQMRLQPRDLRLLELRSQQASILVRPSAILVNLGLVRAIIKHNSVVLFDPLNPHLQDLIQELQERLRLSCEQHDPLPYEFRALETILISVCSTIDATMNDIRPSVNEILSKLTEIDSPDIDKQ
eukprot:Sdes_comp9080_c0_seq1m534